MDVVGFSLYLKYFMIFNKFKKKKCIDCESNWPVFTSLWPQFVIFSGENKTVYLLGSW